MQEQILSATLDYWEHRLSNWALWYVSSSRVGISAYDGEWNDCAPGPTIPIVGEALDTDRLVAKLSTDHIMAVRAYYCWTGTLEQRASALGIHRDTLTDRVRSAKFRLDDLYHAERAARPKPQRLGMVMV